MLFFCVFEMQNVSLFLSLRFQRCHVVCQMTSVNVCKMNVMEIAIHFQPVFGESIRLIMIEATFILNFVRNVKSKCASLDPITFTPFCSQCTTTIKSYIDSIFNSQWKISCLLHILFPFFRNSRIVLLFERYIWYHDFSSK